MTIHADVAAAINQHIPAELEASSAYLRASLDASRLGFTGTEGYFGKQAAEERGHMVKLLTFLNDFDAQATVPSVTAMDQQFNSLAEMFTAAITREETVTQSFNQMLALAHSVGDYESVDFLLWFIHEQTDSERELRTINKRLQQAGANLLEFDEWIEELSNG